MKEVPNKVKAVTSADREIGIASRMEAEDTEVKKFGRIMGERQGVPKESYTYYINESKHIFGFNKSDGGHETTKPGDIVALTPQEELINQNLIATHDIRAIDPARIQQEVDAVKKRTLISKKMTNADIAALKDEEILDICKQIKGKARLDSIADLLKIAEPSRSWRLIQAILDMRDKALGR